MSTSTPKPARERFPAYGWAPAERVMSKADYDAAMDRIDALEAENETMRSGILAVEGATGLAFHDIDDTLRLLQAERDALQAENQRLRNLIGNAEGAALDAGLRGDTLPHEAIYTLIDERDRAEADLVVLRTALVKWRRNAYFDSHVHDELAALVPDDNWHIEP